ncbi:MAG: hypothetical protein P4L28_12130 [Paludibacteraceae bacterium]|nr:hypothetical protein [Paludibacteraceae bacterium]
MKKIFMLLLLSFFTMTHSFAQKSNYRPLDSFAKDTLSYYKYNFIENKDSLVGKKVSALLSMLEVPVKYYIVGLDEKNPNNAKTLILCNKDRANSRAIINSGNDKLYILMLSFSPTIPYATLMDYCKSHGDAITKDQYDYFGQFTITSLGFKAYPEVK